MPYTTRRTGIYGRRQHERQVGLTNPGYIGADVCHLNLHKTFAMPHGGGGPGVGPICVAEHLRKFLPSHSIVPTGGDEGITAVASAPWGSAMLFPITYGYIKMLGGEGLKAATEMAIVNATTCRRPQVGVPHLLFG